MLPEQDAENNSGAYLYFDSNEENFIQSGKVTGISKGFRVRHKEHEKLAKLNKATRKFYSRYPSIHSTRGRHIRKGNFENLVQLVAAGFDQSNEEQMGLLTRSYEDGGVFIFMEEVNERVSKVNYQNKSQKEKKIEMIACLFELGYDLALSPLVNVSEKSGLETIVGMW